MERRLLTILICCVSLFAALPLAGQRSDFRPGALGNSNSRPSKDEAFLRLIESLPPCNSGDSALVTAVITPSASFGCEGGYVVLKAFHPDIYAYLWNTAETTDSITVYMEGTYTVIVYDSNGCQDTASIFVPFFPNTLDISGIDGTGICEGGTVSLEGPGDFLAYAWSNGDSGKTAVFLEPGFYIVSVTDSNTCRFADTFQIVQFPGPVPDLGRDQIACAGESVQLDAGTGFVSYSWSTNENTQTITVSTSGEYFVTVQDSNSCEGMDSVRVTIAALPLQPQITYNNGILTSSGAGTYQWLFEGAVIPGATSQTHKPDTSGRYSVILTDSNGCSITSGEYLIILPVGIVIYEGFSPNGDGINDTWLVENIELFPNNNVVIFNRYGSVVYKAAPYKNDWNGKGLEGKELPDGTYFYKLDLGLQSSVSDELFGGYVIINR